MNEDDLKQLNLDGQLRALDSLSVTTPAMQDAYDFLSKWMRASVSSSQLAADAVGTNSVNFPVGSQSIGTSYASYGGNVSSMWGNVSTVGTGEQNLNVHNLGTGVLTANSQYLQYETSFQFNDTNGTEVIKIYFGTAILFNGTQSGGEGAQFLRLKVGRIGTGSQLYRSETNLLGTTSLDSLGSLTFKLTGQGFGDGTITQNYSIVSWWPA